jgi:hypothetical protein
MNIHEHDCIVLTADLSEGGLQAGDVGTVVHIHGAGAGYEVEFMTLTGQTVGSPVAGPPLFPSAASAVATVLPSQLRPVSK